MNYIWLFMIVVAVVYAAFTGNIAVITSSSLESAKTAVELSIGLIGVLCLWLGLMKIAEEAGLIQIIAKIVRPVMKKLFKDVPEDHPAMGAMVTNLAANMLGLGDAATPLGIKAMQELQTINPDKERATNSMVLFLAMNTSSVQLISTTVIAFRASAGSTNATSIIGPTLIATIISTVVAIISAKMLEKLPAFNKY